MNGFFLIVFSAILHGPAYSCVYRLWWTSFIFLIPLYYAALKNVLSLKHGFMWGSIVFCFQYWALFFLIYEHGYGSYRLLAWLGLLIYIALHAALWMWTTSRVAMLYSIIEKRAIIWFGSTLIYFWWMKEAVLWIFGKWEGTVFSFPLLPLAVNPSIISTICYIGEYGLLASLIFLQLAVALYLLTYKRLYLFFASAALLPFLFGAWFPAQKGENQASIAFVYPEKISSSIAWDHAHMIALALQKAQECNPHATIFIAPESTFIYPLNEYDEYINLWYDALGNKNYTIILGSHFKKNNHVFNSAYLLFNRKIEAIYHKKHTMFFTERVPPGWGVCGWPRTLFLKHCNPFCESVETKRPVWQLTTKLSVTPHICSDIFFCPDREKRGSAELLCMANDSWFSARYMRELMYCAGQYVATKNQCALIYASWDETLR